jgi:alkyl sulfatase BDS1-like metallo-beta-lactamase superfamily hydrolase
MGAVREFASQLLSGAIRPEEQNPFTTFLGLEEYAPGVAFVSGFANAVAIDTGEGLVVVDTGSQLTGAMIHGSIRGWTNAPIDTIVYTHGHVDHVMGAALWDGDAAGANVARPTVIAHELVPKRFERYVKTAGYNAAINARQFRVPGLQWPTEYRQPDVLVKASHTISKGGVTIELRHDRGETDDHLWSYVELARALCTGDLFIWASPNCGNPQKVQRYPLEWANALDAMRAKNARVLFPGHGPAIEGEETVREVLETTARLLRSLHDQCVALMNEGLALADVIAGVRVDEGLLGKPWLRPVYDEPEFVLRNLWRLYGGWYDGNPAHLKPAHPSAIALEVASLSGGAGALIDRAEKLCDAGDLRLACELAEWAGRAAPDDEGIRSRRAAIYRTRAERETSLMARGVYEDAANK